MCGKALEEVTEISVLATSWQVVYSVDHQTYVECKQIVCDFLDVSALLLTKNIKIEEVVYLPTLRVYTEEEVNYIAHNCLIHRETFIMKLPT